MKLPNLENVNKFNIFLKLMAVYIVGVIIYYCLGCFDKNLCFVPDERLYIQAAKALANGTGIRYNGLQSTFQKIFYSIIISPAFLVKNLKIQTRLICLFSTLFEMTFVFPTYFISRRLGFSRINCILICIFSLFFPNLLFSMTYMSESAFLPLWLWTIYLVVCLLDSKEDKNLDNKKITSNRIFISILLGILSYLLYMCKEVGIVALPAFIIISIILVISKKAKFSCFIPCIVSLITFFVLFLLMKYLIFNGAYASYSYSVTIPKAPETNSKNPISFMLYSALYYLSYIILVVGVFPTFIRCKKQDEKSVLNDKLAIYIEICVLMLVFIIVYKILLSENYGSLSPRLHLRYMEPLFLPYIICFVAKIKDLDENSVFINKYLKLAFIIYLCVLVLIPGFGANGLLDDTIATFYQIPNRIALHLFLGNSRKTIILTYIMKILIFIVAVLGSKLLKNNKKKFATIFVAVLIILNSISIGIKYYELRSSYMLPIKFVDEAQEVNDTINDLPGKKLIIVNENTRVAEIMVTFYDMKDSDIFIADFDYDPTSDAVVLNAYDSNRTVKLNDYDYIIYGNGVWTEDNISNLRDERVLLETDNYIVISQ